MPNFDRAEAGHFYAIGVGPGAPDLMTLRAAHLIRGADVVVMPRSEQAEESRVAATVKDCLARQEIITHVYPMGRDEQKTLQSWAEVAQQVAARCRAGKAVAQITLGDPLLYSTSAYLLATLAGQLPPDRIHVVPGISAYQATAARFGAPLALQEDRVLIMPATDLARVAQALDQCETLILYKAGRHLEALADLLAARGLLDRAALACYIEQGERECVTRDLRQAARGQHGYLATVIIHVGHRGWKQE